MKTSSNYLNCCVCRTNKFSTKYKKIDGFELLLCKACGLIFLDKVSINPETFLKDADQREPEIKAEYWGYPEYFKKYSHLFNHFFEERLLRIKSCSPPKGEWFDVGSGYGLWQTFLKDKEIENSGIEIENNAYNYTRSINLKTELVSFENFKPKKTYSVITMCDVLEHIEDPAMALEKAYKMLEPGGLLYIQVPNVIGFKIPYGDHLGLPHHLWQFSPAPLKKLSEQAGFKLIDYWTGTQGVVRYYENGGPRFYHRALWFLAYQLKIGNRLQVLLQK